VFQITVMKSPSSNNPIVKGSICGWSERTTCKLLRKSMAGAESGFLQDGDAKAHGMGPTAR